MSEAVPKGTPPVFVTPVSSFTGPIAELIAQRMLFPPSRPGLLAVLDQLEILRVLGGGGMGIVLLARDSASGQDVAIKLVKPDLLNNQTIVHRFLKEAGHLKRLRHTNIVPVREISDRAEGPYFVMPYFEKGSLANRIQPGQPLDTESILDIAAQVADGLSFAHRSGIIHRDLKPANILMTADGKACLADFGLARTLFNDTIVDVENRNLEGTTPYMSPAIAAGDAEDTRCDIYSFGALLYEMLTGQPPYRGRGTKEILDQIIAGPPKPVINLNPNADRNLVAVADGCMARELRDRYADMRDVLKDLQRIRENKTPKGQQRIKGPGRNTIFVNLNLFRVNLKILWVSACAIIIVSLSWIFWLEHSKSVSLDSVDQTAASQSSPNKPNDQPAASQLPTQHQPASNINTLAGQAGVGGYADGAGNQAQFRLPNSVAVDDGGNVYVADTANNAIRKIAPNGEVSTFAGIAGAHGNTDGISGNARFWAPFGIAVDPVGNVYVADSANNSIRKITSDGIVSTLAGMAGFSGSQDGVGSTARFRNPWGIAVDRLGNVFVADMSNDTVRKITPSGRVTTLAGQAGMNGRTDGFGKNARFNGPFAVAVDAAENVYVSDSGNNTIRKIMPDGSVVTLAGLTGYSGYTNGQGNNARFYNPQGLAVDSVGNLYVSDRGNNTVRKITPLGEVTTLSGLVEETTGNVRLNSPGGVAVDREGNIYVADTNNHCVRKISPLPPANP